MQSCVYLVSPSNLDAIALLREEGGVGSQNSVVGCPQGSQEDSPDMFLKSPSDRQEPNREEDGLPGFDDRGFLPDGIHEADWQAVTTRFGRSAKRQELLQGLQTACCVLYRAGVEVLYLDGSFVTDKTNPGDYDACWDMEESGVDLDMLPACMRPGMLNPVEQRALFKGDFNSMEALRPYRFFGTDPNPRGLVALNLSTVNAP